MDLHPIPGRQAIAQLNSAAAIPDWAQQVAPLVSITRTEDELSIVCPEEWVPDSVRRSPGWFCLKVAGALDLAAVGILASLVDPLRDKGISVFALSTYASDCLLLPEVHREAAISALEAAGHHVDRSGAD
jgi:uncharacterized protein